MRVRAVINIFIHGEHAKGIVQAIVEGAAQQLEFLRPVIAVTGTTAIPVACGNRQVSAVYIRVTRIAILFLVGIATDTLQRQLIVDFPFDREAQQRIVQFEIYRYFRGNLVVLLPGQGFVARVAIDL